MDRAALGALRDAIDTILNWPNSVRDQIAQWLQTDASKPNGADPGRLSRSRSNRRRGFKPSEKNPPRASGRYWKLCATIRRLVSCSGRRQPAATRARSPCNWPMRQARPRRAGRQRSLRSPRQTLDSAVALTAEVEAELLAPSPSHPAMANSYRSVASRDVLLRVQRVQFPEMRGMISVRRFG